MLLVPLPLPGLENRETRGTQFLDVAERKQKLDRDPGHPAVIAPPSGLGLFQLNLDAQHTCTVAGSWRNIPITLIDERRDVACANAYQDEKQARTEPPPPTSAGVSAIACLYFPFSRSRMTIIKASASYFACVKPSTTAATL